MRRARAGPPAPSATTPESARGHWPALLELAFAACEDWTAFIGGIVQLDEEALRVAGVSYWTMSADTLYCEAGAVVRAQLGTVAMPRLFEHGALLTRGNHPEYFEALREGRILSIEDVDADPRVRGLRDYCAARGISSMLNVPIVVDGRVAGVLCHEHVGPKRRWSAADEDFATSAAQVVAFALRARAHTAAESAAHQAAFLDNFSRALFRSLDVHSVARQALGLVVPELGDGALLFALNRDGALECLATTHVDPQRRDLVEEYGRGEIAQVEPPGLPRLVLRRLQSVVDQRTCVSLLERYGFSQALLDVIRALETTAAMGVPLAIGDRVFGCLMLVVANRAYDSDALALAEQVANRIAMALDNARLYETAREAIRARDEFLVLAAHELRTPLTALRLRTASLCRGAGGGRDVNEMTARDVRRICALVEQMFDAARIRAEGIALNVDSCDLATIVHRCVRDMADRARSAGCSIDVRSEPSLVGRWDRARLGQVVDHLLDNAIKFSERKPIEVALERNGTEAVLMVRDHGLSIAPERLPSIFAPFERAVPREHFGGLGLGLYIAKSIVEAHGGSLTVTSRLAEGSTFVVRLPLGFPTSETEMRDRPSSASRAKA